MNKVASIKSSGHWIPEEALDLATLRELGGKACQL